MQSVYLQATWQCNTEDSKANIKLSPLYTIDGVDKLVVITTTLRCLAIACCKHKAASSNRRSTRGYK